MAIRPYAHHLHTDYRARADADVRGGKKRDHVFVRPPLHEVATPHVRCEVTLSTEGCGVHVRDFFDYKGAIPSSPVLLGAGRTDEYRGCARATGVFGRARVGAGFCAIIVGAMLGVSGIAVAMLPTVYRLGFQAAKLSLQISRLPLPVVAVVSVTFFALEVMAYAKVHRSFSDLLNLSNAYDIMTAPPGMFTPAERRPFVAQGCVRARAAQAGSDWVLMRAAEEMLHEATKREFLQEEHAA